MIGQIWQRVGERVSGVLKRIGRAYQRVRDWALKGPIRRTIAFLTVFGSIGSFTCFLWLVYGTGLADSLIGDRRWVQLRNADLRAQATAIYDAKGRFSGVIHPEGEPDHLGEYKRAETLRIGTFPDHKSVPVYDAPEFFWRCAVYTEDRHRRTLGNPFGVDGRGILQMPFTGRGGSTLEMQLARSLYKMNPDAVNRYKCTPDQRKNREVGKEHRLCLSGFQSIRFKFKRKFKEWYTAPILSRRLIPGQDELEMRRWFANHVPLISAGGGESGSIYGVYGAGQYLFGKRPEELDIAEQLILAAAVRTPIYWRAEPDDPTNEEAVTRTRESRAIQIRRAIGTPEKRGRARLCARPDMLLQDGQPVVPDAALLAAYPGLEAEEARQRLVARLDELSDPSLWVPTPAGFEDATRALRMGQGPVATGPTRLVMEIAPNVQRETAGSLAEELKREDDASEDGVALFGRYLHPWRGRVREVHITLDLEKNYRFRSKVRSALPGIGDELAADGRFRRGALPFRNEDGDLKRGEMPVLLVAADENGRIVRYYNSGQDAFFFGFRQQREDLQWWGSGAYVLDKEQRSVASTAKVAAALLISEGGETNVSRTVTNECLGMLEESCFDPKKPDAGTPLRVSIRQIYAESLNSPLVRLINEKSSPERILALMRPLGFKDPADLDSEDLSNVSTELVLGRFSGRPRATLWLMGVAFEQVRETGNAVRQPFLIERMVTIDEDDRSGRSPAKAVDMPQSAFDSGTFFGGATSASFLEEVLSEPLCNTGGKATLRRLAEWCARGNRNVRVHIAKSGTVPACGEKDSACKARVPSCGGGSCDEMDWWIVGAIEFADGRSYTYLATMGAADRSRAFARDMGGGRLSPLVSILLEDLREHGG